MEVISATSVPKMKAVIIIQVILSVSLAGAVIGAATPASRNFRSDDDYSGPSGASGGYSSQSGGHYPPSSSDVETVPADHESHPYAQAQVGLVYNKHLRRWKIRLDQFK